MKNYLLITIYLSLFIHNSYAQFIENGEIEYEVKTNIKKTMGNSMWAESMKDKIPTFKTVFYKYTFSNNKSICQFDRWENKESLPEFLRQGEDKYVWYTDFNNATYHLKKEIFGSIFNIKDSIKNIQWKLTNENRIIAGYNCKKAIGIIMDSIYVFAFFSEEFTIPGGPCTINNLPGMILGMTIPRLYTSWIANKVTIKDTIIIIDEPLETKNMFTSKSAIITIKEKTKNWMNDDDPESGKWMNQMIWNLIL